MGLEDGGDEGYNLRMLIIVKGVIRGMAVDGFLLFGEDIGFGFRVCGGESPLEGRSVELLDVTAGENLERFSEFRSINGV